MPALTQATAPTALVTEIPGRYAPIMVVDKRTPASIISSTATTTPQVLLPRVETANFDFQTPTAIVNELGTTYNVGEIDDLPENKTTLTSYDVGKQALSVLCSKAASGSFGFPDLAAGTNIDIIQNFADPNGYLFYSRISTENVITDYGMSLKAKSAAMESFGLANFNQLGFRGAFMSKSYVVQAADVTNGYITVPYGANQAPVPLFSSTISNYWAQRGCINFVKIERYRAATGWTLYTETTGAPVAGTSCKLATGHLTFAAGDLTLGDLFIVTYATWVNSSDATTVGLTANAATTNYVAMATTSIDTSDAVAVNTRLTPISINAYNVPRGQALDFKVTLKRDRAEGIGDTNGLWGPPASPEVSLQLDVKRTDSSLNSLMVTGQPLGSDGGYTANSDAGDFFDPNYMTRYQLNNAVPVSAVIYDPRATSTALKTLSCPTAVFKQYQVDSSTKNPVTVKYTGSDRIGNFTIS